MATFSPFGSSVVRRPIGIADWKRDIHKVRAPPPFCVRLCVTSNQSLERVDTLPIVNTHRELGYP
jgi:hypothetical protein